MDSTMPRVVTWLAFVVAPLIVAASVIALLVEPETYGQHHMQFESVVTDTLLPLFGVALGAEVVYKVGMELAKKK